MSVPVVEIRNLWKRYGTVDAVRGVSLSIQAGEIFGLLGPNGAGKTSTLECLVGLRDPDDGQFSIGGVDARRNPRVVKERIGVALQSTALPDKLTAREALTLFGSFYRDREPVADLLVRFGLQEKADMPFDALSGGQRQRLALAIAFVNRPSVLIFDEPTMGLDPRARQELHEEILRMKTGGHTVLLSTHYLEEAEKLCDRIAIIDRGVVVATGAPRDLMAGAGNRRTVVLRLSHAVPRAWMERLPEVEEIAGADAEYRLFTPSATRVLAALMPLLSEQGIEVLDLQVGKASLEDLFLRLTERPGQ